MKAVMDPAAIIPQQRDPPLPLFLPWTEDILGFLPGLDKQIAYDES
jgi:hypothetical protein